MRETPRAFERRTGRGYAPTALLRALGRPLRAAEACPTLFRYPGPLGIRDALLGPVRRLAPSDARIVWLSQTPAGGAAGARLFGAVAVLEPLRLSPCRAAETGAWIGRNVDPGGRESVVWIPAGRAAEALPWDRIREAGEVVDRLGRTYADRRAQVLEKVSAYIEEIDAVAASGAPLPERPWHRVPVAQRRRLLSRAGLVPRWTPLR